MERSQSFQGDLYPTLNRQLIEGGAVPAMGSIPRNADGDNPRQQTPHQPTANYPSGPSPFPTTGNSYTYSFRSEENRDSNRPVGSQFRTFKDSLTYRAPGVDAGPFSSTDDPIVPVQPPDRAAKPMEWPGSSRRTALWC